MIDPEDIKDVQLVPDSGDPPRKAFFLMGIPGIQRITPQLSGGREVIRRDPGHLEGIAVRIQLEEMLAGPYVCAVHGNKYGDIPDNPDILLIGIFFQAHPFIKEQELRKLVEANGL